MTPEEFESALDDHGVDLSAWPAQRRALAEVLLASSAKARHSLAQAKALERMVEVHLKAPVRAPQDLAKRIMGAAGIDAPEAAPSAEIIAYPVRAKSDVPPRSRLALSDMRLAATVAAVLVVCFISGILSVQAFSPVDSTVSVYLSGLYADLAW